MKTGLPKREVLTRVRVRGKQKIKNVQKFLTATEFRQNTATFLSGGLIAFLILHAIPNTERVMLQSMASTDPEVAAAVNQLMLYFIGETILVWIGPVAIYGIYKNRKMVKSAFWTAINLLLLPSIVYLHTSWNHYLGTGQYYPLHGIALAILTAKAGQWTWKEVKTK